MPDEAPVRVARELASRGYNADREAVTLLLRAPDLDDAIERALEAAPEDALKIGAGHVRAALAEMADDEPSTAPGGDGYGGTRRSSRNRTAPEPAQDTENGSESPNEMSSTNAAESGDSPSSRRDSPSTENTAISPERDPSVSSGDARRASVDSDPDVPVETEGYSRSARSPTPAEITGDMTGQSTGTGTYRDFVSVFRDRYERLGAKLRGRVNHRPADSIAKMSGGSDVAMVGMVNDVRSTAGGHWLVELEDSSGVFPALVMKDREYAGLVDEILLDEVVAVEGTLADDGGIVFVDSLHFPDVPRTYQPSTADREVEAALVSDVHVGSQEFMGDAWSRFASWLHTPEAESVEYLLIAGDMVEGVGVYPGQDEELTVVDIYDQYRAFAERLKEVPGDLEIVMIPGNHDAVRLAEPQPAFDDELRAIMSPHDARVTSNPSTVTIEGVDVLMYHGVSLDEIIAELPDDRASYEEPHRAMFQLLKKRHLAPQYGGRMRIAPEEKDHLVIDEVPDVFHAGHVHKVGVGTYHNVRVINSGAWQSQTNFQASVDLMPDAAIAPIVSLDTLDVTLRKFD